MERDIEADSPMIGQKLCHEARKFKQYLAAISVCLGATCAGTILSWSSPALSQLLPRNETNSTEAFQREESQFTVSATEAALIGSMVGIGAMISAVPTGYLADKFGRKKMILSLSLPFMLNWILIVFAQNPAMIIAGRFFAGMGTGGICVLAPIYIGEIAEVSLRGILGTFVQTCLSAGILLCSIIGAFTTWVTLSVILMSVPLAFLATFSIMPESPVYLVRIKEMSKAEDALREFRGSTYDIDTELKKIERNLEESHTTTGFRELFHCKAHRKAFFAGIITLALQQLCGINAIVFYTGPIFKAAGSSLRPDVVAIIVNAVQVVVAYFAVFFIEKANRKFYLILSSLGMMACLTVLGMFFHAKHIFGDVSGYGFIPVACAVLYMVNFCIGFGPIPWLLLSELYAPEIKGIACGAAVTTNWFCAFLVTFCFPLLDITIGIHYTFYVFAAINAIAVFLVAIFIPETKGRTLDEIQNILKG